MYLGVNVRPNHNAGTYVVGKMSTHLSCGFEFTAVFPSTIPPLVHYVSGSCPCQYEAPLRLTGPILVNGVTGTTNIALSRDHRPAEVGGLRQVSG